MQLTTILAVLFSCLVLFASIGYTDGAAVKTQTSRNRPNTFGKSRENLGVRHQTPFIKNGRGQSPGRAMIESIKKRRQH